MKLYHLPVSDDATGDTLTPVVEHVVTAAGGRVHLSRSHGAGPAIFVISLPSTVSLEDVGLVAAKFITEEDNEQSEEGTGNGSGAPSGEPGQEEGSVSTETATVGEPEPLP